MYEAHTTTDHVYGREGRPLSIRFESKNITQESDILGITKYLLEDGELRNHLPFTHLQLETIFGSSPPESP